MANINAVADIITQITKTIIDDKIILLYTDDKFIQDNQISIKNKVLTNFGSCSYLGLEFDERLKNMAKSMIDQYGTQFSESRSYVSIHAYKQLEEKLEALFGANVVVTPTTTLGHFSNLPVLVNPLTDAVLVDHQVHNSIQMAVQMLKGSGVYTELLRHNRMDLLEERIRVLKLKYKHIWYMADGIYSMFGDRAPVKELEVLLNRYEQFRLYIDDAHGMSVYGKNGRGYVLQEIPLHPHMILGTSLNKAFASGGGVMVYPTKELAQKVRLCGGPMITSGPLQPAMLGAAIASATIHLSPEIINLQNDLQDNIKFAMLMLSKTILPVLSEPGSPVIFIGVHLPKVGFNLVQRMMNEGFYVNLGLFPAVPLKNTGIRFTITRLHSFQQIEALVKALEYHWEQALKEEGVLYADVFHAFKLTVPAEKQWIQKPADSLTTKDAIKIFHYTSIRQIPQKEWNAIFGGKGNLDYNGLWHLERAFSNNKAKEQNAIFDYFILKNKSGKIVLATFTTCNLQKDDMLANAAVSASIEKSRIVHPYYLTSTVLQTGSMFSEGEHIYYDSSDPLYKDAFLLLFKTLANLQDKYKANSIVLRDFYRLGKEMDDFFIGNGFLRVALPDAHYLDLTKWEDEVDFLQQLNAANRYHFRSDIQSMADNFLIEYSKSCTSAEMEDYYKMYLQVKKRNLLLNVFDLPLQLFQSMFGEGNSNWELIKVWIKNGTQKVLAAVVFSYHSGNSYHPMIIGIQDEYLYAYKVYKQSLYQMIKRAKALGCTTVQLGFGASLEKRKLGAVAVPVSMYITIKDNYHQSVIAEMVDNVLHSKPKMIE